MIFQNSVQNRIKLTLISSLLFCLVAAFASISSSFSKDANAFLQSEKLTETLLSEDWAVIPEDSTVTSDPRVMLMHYTALVKIMLLLRFLWPFRIQHLSATKDRFTHALAFGAQLEGSAVRPGLFYQIYLKKDLSRFIDGVLGIKLEASI